MISIGYIDLLKVVKIEPNNTLARQELESIKARIAKVEGKKKVRPCGYKQKIKTYASSRLSHLKVLCGSRPPNPSSNHRRPNL